MIFAGVAGSAVCADLGARKVREEFDALAVMGVDHVRSVILPRVVALTLGAAVLGLLALLVTFGTAILLAPPVTGVPRGVFIDGVRLNVLSIDVFASIIKYLLIGFFVGIVACQKGANARGGTRGVGSAVNQTVVLSFLGIWIINSLFNLALLTAFPGTASRSRRSRTTCRRLAGCCASSGRWASSPCGQRCRCAERFATSRRSCAKRSR
jgi:phospholipid/cholesterol/gamma-HCH transport system permease protein